MENYIIVRCIQFLLRCSLDIGMFYPPSCRLVLVLPFHHELVPCSHCDSCDERSMEEHNLKRSLLCSLTPKEGREPRDMDLEDFDELCEKLGIDVYQENALYLTDFFNPANFR